MAAETNETTTQPKKANIFASRQFNGTSFLTLEHVGYFVLVVLVPTIVAIGALTAVDLWTRGANPTLRPLANWTGMLQPSLLASSATAIQTVAALVVLVPLMYMLRRRTAAEYDKRGGYRNRVAYKLPVYTALAILVASTIGWFISLVAVFLNSLAQIGMPDANIGLLYLGEFLPALFLFAVYGSAAWYVLWLAKGKDASRIFVNVTGLLAAAVVLALFITALSLNHDTSTRNSNPYQHYFEDNGSGGSKTFDF